jgi:hypothetical protein
MGYNIFNSQTEQKRYINDFYLRVVTDINAGLTPIQIAARYTNPITGKPYTRQHIYWIIRKLKRSILNTNSK